MEIKKTPKADLENKKSTWMLIGYVIVLAFMFIAFEWTKRDIKIDTSQALTDLYFEEEMVPITEQEEKVAPPPPEVAPINETLEIVADDADVEETVIASSEETGKAVEVKYVPVTVVEEEPEENLADFMIYMLFFMKFLSGPIERARDMLPQLKSGKPVAYPSIVYGMKLIVVGLIKKLILADYISPYIDGIFNSIHTASGIQLLMACLLYPVELYGDFSGYTDIALGGACMLGFKLSPNFNRPFIAQTTAEFWRRWHMSLSFWVRDYLYLPLSSGMRRWGQWGVFLSLSLTFAGLGAWHGAGWNYIIYGLIQGLIIFYEMKTAMICNKIKNWIGNPLFTTLSILRTYLLFAFSLIFFRLESVSDALYYIRNISFSTHASWKEVSIGIPDHNCIVAGSALVLILVYEYIMSKRDLLEALEKQPMLVRWGIYYLLAIMFFTLGQFNSDSFIYLQF